MAERSVFRRFMSLGEWGKYPIPTADCISVGILAVLGDHALQAVFPAMKHMTFAPLGSAVLMAVLSTLWVRWLVKRGAGSKLFW